jgi:hypothetical protein
MGCNQEGIRYWLARQTGSEETQAERSRAEGNYRSDKTALDGIQEGQDEIDGQFLWSAQR